MERTKSQRYNPEEIKDIIVNSLGNYPGINNFLSQYFNKDLRYTTINYSHNGRSIFFHYKGRKIKRLDLLNIPIISLEEKLKSI
jgi:hypothetical protein